MQYEGAGCLLLSPNEQYVLLGERNPNYKTNKDKKHEFEYFGGKIEEGKQIWETAIRKVEEEAKIRLSLKQIQDSKSLESVSPQNKIIVLYRVVLTKQQESDVSDSMCLFNNESDSPMKSVVWVPVQKLADHVYKGDPLPYDLPLRKFNIILLKKYIERYGNV